jgi:hypothetical protein
MTKVYGLRGMTEAVLYFANGKIKATFKGGIADKAYNTPAKLITSNPVVQAAIEADPRFGATIFLQKSVGGIGDKPILPETKEETPSPVADGEEKSYENVTTVGQAMNVLKSLGIKASAMRTKESVLAAAESINVSFPNLKA